MNKHINPADTVKEIGTVPAGTIGVRQTEQFLLVRGKHAAWVDGDLMSRSEIIKEVDNDAYEDLRFIIALSDTSAETGTWRKATDEITDVVISRWAEDDKILTEKQRDFVAMCKGEAFANGFHVDAA